MATTDFDTYTVIYYSAPDFSLHSRIMLLKNNSPVARLNFVAEGQTVPPNTRQSWGATINFPQQQFAEVMDLLRNEEPLYVWQSDTNAEFCSIQTDREPVGEEELN